MGSNLETLCFHAYFRYTEDERKRHWQSVLNRVISFTASRVVFFLSHYLIDESSIQHQVFSVVLKQEITKNFQITEGEEELYYVVQILLMQLYYGTISYSSLYVISSHLNGGPHSYSSWKQLHSLIQGTIRQSGNVVQSMNNVSKISSTL